MKKVGGRQVITSHASDDCEVDLRGDDEGRKKSDKDLASLGHLNKS